MIRALITAAAIAGVGLLPAAGAAPANCTPTTADSSCAYANCLDAKEAGVCDIRKGDLAYCAQQDLNGDGIACNCQRRDARS